ncbi:hypothetical protein ACTXT7_001668 [Hymenolepis weldensis]
MPSLVISTCAINHDNDMGETGSEYGGRDFTQKSRIHSVIVTKTEPWDIRFFKINIPNMKKGKRKFSFGATTNGGETETRYKLTNHISLSFAYHQSQATAWRESMKAAEEEPTREEEQKGLNTKTG